jgi:predicted transcriptional regulator
MASETLANLATIIVREHQLTYQSAYDALTHAIACGEALLRSQQAVPEGNWQNWVTNNTGLTLGVAGRFMRIARNRELLAEADRRLDTINAAISYLHELEVPAAPRRTGKRPTFDVEKAKQLREQGMTYAEIGKQVGVSDVAVARQFSPEQRRRAIQHGIARQKRRRAEARQAEERERAERVQQSGGEAAEAYALLQRCALVLAQREAFATALVHVRNAMKAIEQVVS